MNAPTIVARLSCDEPTARRLADELDDALDPDDCVLGGFTTVDGQWRLELYFRMAPNEPAVRALVAKAAGSEAAAAMHFESLAATDWVAASLANLPPVEAGRFTVHGAHNRARVPANRIGIVIEAGLAFGTGHHGTTRGCLLALDTLAKRRRVRNVLDVGTGSGVLAIAAAKALRVPVTALDIDTQALATARANAQLNGAASFIACARADGVRAVRGRYSLVFANILLPVLKRMAADLARRAARGGFVVLSGLLPADANAALAIYSAQGLRLERRILREGWMTLVLRKP